MSPRPGGDVSNSSEFAVMGSGEHRRPQPERESARSAAVRFIKARPGLALILAYLAITIVARYDDVWFYQLFRINLFTYSAPQDVFLAPLRNSIVVIFFLVPAAVLFLISWISENRRRSDIAPAGLLSGRWNTPTLRLVFASLVVFFAAGAMAREHATQRYERVKSGRGRIVTFTRTDGVTFGENPLLMGSAGNFFFLYYPKRDAAEIVPMDNTALMTVDLGTPADASGRSLATPPRAPGF